MCGCGKATTDYLLGKTDENPMVKKKPAKPVKKPKPKPKGY